MSENRTCEQLCDEVIRNVRLAFHQLKTFGDRLHGSLGITSSMRGVLESLAEGGPQTVSQMARARPVSRQHIQALVDELMKAGLVESHGNPAHKRSPLLVLTPTGLRRFTEIRRREQSVLAALVKKFSVKDLSIMLSSLKRLRAILAELAGPRDRKTKRGDDPK
jgi:DNA-binding MarR family transcriptional regulator